jgi:hypothetical protein
MKGNVMKTTRRETTKLLLGALASVPVVSLVASAAAEAQELPHLMESDPSAKALMYHDDATKAPRADKSGVPADQQFCHSCMFLQQGTGQWRPCQIFPANTVNIDGWCLTWTPKGKSDASAGT